MFKLFTGLVRVGRVVYRGGDLYSTVSGIVNDSKTIFTLDPNVGTSERLLATGSLLLDLSGAKDVYGWVKGGINF